MVPDRIEAAASLKVLDNVQRCELVTHRVAGTPYVVVRNLVRQRSVRRRHAVAAVECGEEPAAIAAMILSRRQKPSEVDAALQIGGGPASVEAGGAVAEPGLHHLAQWRACQHVGGPFGSKSSGGAVGHVVLVRGGSDAVLRCLARPSAREEQLRTGTRFRANAAHV